MLDKKLDNIEENIVDNGATKKRFYNSTWWLFMWSILVWPIGLIVLWSYFDRVRKNELPRTKLIKENLEDL